MPKVAVNAFKKLPKLNYSRVRFIFCDERLVPFDDAESTFGAYKKTFIPEMEGNVTDENFIVIDPRMAGWLLFYNEKWD